MTAPPARPHMGLRPSSHFSIITAAQSSTDWAEDDAWDSGSDDDKPLALRKTPAPTPPTPSRANSQGFLSTTSLTPSKPSSTNHSPLRPNPPSAPTNNAIPTPIPFKQPAGPTSLNMIRASSGVPRKTGGISTDPNLSVGSGTPNSSSSNAELSFSYTHVQAPSPSSYQSNKHVLNLPEAESRRESVEVSSPPGHKGKGWTFITGRKKNKDKDGDDDVLEREKEGYRRWQMSATGSVDFGGILPDAPDSEESDGEAMIVGDLDVDVGDTSGPKFSLGPTEEKEILDFKRAQGLGSDDDKGKGREGSAGREILVGEDDECTPREKVGVEAIREDADAIVSDPFSVLRRADPYGHASGYNNKPPSRTQSASQIKSPERPNISAKRMSTFGPTTQERTSSSHERTSSNQTGAVLARGRSIRTNRRHAQFVECLSREDINMSDVKKLAWSGVPPHLRPIVWPLLLGYIPLPSAMRLQTLQRKREEYNRLVKITFARGREGLDQQIWHQIKIDVPRTRPGVRLWMEAGTHQSLERILYIWAIRHPASGYVQGINDLATPFYQIFLSAYIDADPETYDPACLPPHIMNAIEADSFWCLSRLLDGIQDNYIVHQPGIHRSVKRMAELVKRIDAPLAAHLESQSVEFMQFAFRWMNCLLMRELSVKNTIRMWDTYLAEGPDSFSQFHLYVCSAFLVKWSDKLKNMDFQGIIMFLQSLPTQGWTDYEIELLLSEAFLLSSVWHNAQSHFGLATTAMSATQGYGSGKTFSYETDSTTDPAAVGPNPPAFGLKNTTSTTYWSDFKNSINKLQKEAPNGVKYVVCWFGRHGQGWHNVAESYYGTANWDDYWSKLNGDGNMTWGPDALLTDLGKQQAQLAHNTWATELAKSDPVPLPTKLYSSPMSRAASTLEITFTGILLTESGKKGAVHPDVMEGLREVIGVHTCDKRRTKSYIRKTYTGFHIEHGFTEEDELWTADHRETDAEAEVRLKAALDTIFGNLLGHKDTFISITAHSGAIRAALRVLGHRDYSLPTGGVIPVIIKATQS
ncbi:GTPase-activating protein gyp1 [Ceratobasidium theobromae]|uniref:GTPase-activating protein gyp1 n=1 Tax=Ceratobasidium theobromae TaxID=1582974 RepID=A0A5N5QJR5_9AGAM|nr:GTPase-activating protein gyp1 [Ceratobasidium theobromae]